MADNPPLSPVLIVILGSTGSGKTKLSIELAESLISHYGASNFTSEILSADSMQIYKNIDVLSAKATLSERNRIKHHLLDIVDVDDSSFNVLEYQERASRLLTSLFSTPNFSSPFCLPILVGGTNYYIESLIWEGKYHFDKIDKIEIAEEQRKELESLSNETLHQKLKEVDPRRAELLHPNARRKVVRSLEIWLGTNKSHSEWLDELKNESKPKLRFPTCFLWVQCENDILTERLNSRVDSMIESGLKEELKLIADRFKGKEMNYETGVLQSIGIREFAPWITKYQTDGQDSTIDFENGVQLLKTHTRQYAKSQLSWIKNSLVSNVQIFRLDASNVKEWDQNVLKPAIDIVKSILDGKKIEQIIKEETFNDNYPSVQFLDIKETPTVEWKKFFCEVCQRTLNGTQEWNVHLKSRLHKSMMRKQRIKNNANNTP